METKNIGKKIVEARKKLQFSQAQMADALCISPQAVGKWERGESLPDFIQFTKLAKLLHVDLNYFSSEFPSVVSFNDEKVTDKSTESKIQSTSWDFSKGQWKDADFSKATSIGEKIASSNMNNCQFNEANLQSVQFSGNHIQSCSFQGANLENAQFLKSHLAKNDFSGANLNSSVFNGSYFSQIDLSHSTLNHAQFIAGGWDHIKGLETSIQHVVFKDMYIGNTVFSGEINHCSFDMCAFKNVRFEHATLKQTFFKCRSLKKLTFVDVKMDRITHSFLKNGGAHLSGVEIIDEE